MVMTLLWYFVMLLVVAFFVGYIVAVVRWARHDREWEERKKREMAGHPWF